MVTRRASEEIARLGDEICERDIRQEVEAEHHGAVVAIDVESGTRAIGDTGDRCTGLPAYEASGRDLTCGCSGGASGHCITLVVAHCGTPSDGRSGERRP